MTPLATSDQLASRMKKDLDRATADLAVTHGSGLVRAITGQVFTFVSQETVVLLGNEQALTLPQRPAVIDSGANPLTVVELGDYGAVDYTCLEQRDFTRIGNVLTRGNPWWNYNTRLQGWPRRRGGYGVWAPRVQVTYSHGYQAAIPDDVVSTVLDAATILYDNPTVLRSLTIDDYTETRATEVLGANMVSSIYDRLVITGRASQAFMIRL